MNFFIQNSKLGKEAIKDLPLATNKTELIDKRCKYVGLAIPFAIVGENTIDLRNICPMCNDNKIIMNGIEMTLKCIDCLNVKE